LDVARREADGGRLRARRFGEDGLTGDGCTVTGGSALAGGTAEPTSALDCAFAAASKPSGATKTMGTNPTNRRDTAQPFSFRRRCSQNVRSDGNRTIRGWPLAQC
jgi:hypothetical protein